MSPECPREAAVVNAVLSGQWPHRCDEGLIAHAGECATCREVANVSLLLREDSQDSRIEMHVPAAGQVWWRAAVRARLEGTKAAARPITWMHGITGAIALGALLAAITTVWPMLPGALDVMRTEARQFFPSAEVAEAITTVISQSLLIGVIAAAFLVLAPLALYFALSDD